MRLKGLMNQETQKGFVETEAGGPWLPQRSGSRGEGRSQFGAGRGIGGT